MLSSALSADNTHSSTLPIWAIPAILSDQFPAPMKKLLIRTALLSLVMLAFVAKLPAQVPQLISYQGRVGVDGVNFDGSGQFKFAFINAAGTTTYWSNDGSSTAGSEPGTAINIQVSKGLYAVLLGDATLDHMSIVPATVFTHGDVHLRVWFSDGVNGFQQLTPDRRIAAVGYAMMADSVSDGAITTAKLADGAVTSAKLAAGALGTVKGTLPWVVVSGTSQQAEPNTGYVAANAAEVTVTLPPTPEVGDIVRVSSLGLGGWKIAQNSGQSIIASQIALPGTIWTARDTVRDWSCVASSSDGLKLIAGVDNGAQGGNLYTSTDGGISWAPRASVKSWRSVASSSDGTKLVAVVREPANPIYTSSDSGNTWLPRETARNWSSVSSSADGTKLVAVVSGGKIYRSADSGVSWSVAYNIDSLWGAVAMSADGSKIIVANSTYVLHSIDSGTSWTSRGLGNNTQNVSSVTMSANGNTMAAVSNYVFVSNDSGSSWVERYGPLSGASGVACSADGTKIILPSVISIDSGHTWVQRNFEGVQIAASADGNKLVIARGGQYPIYISSTKTTVGNSGFLRGAASTAVELQYISNGQFQPLSSVGTIYPY
jgi:hypothetical protein